MKREDTIAEKLFLLFAFVRVLAIPSSHRVRGCHDDRKP